MEEVSVLVDAGGVNSVGENFFGKEILARQVTKERYMKRIFTFHFLPFLFFFHIQSAMAVPPLSILQFDNELMTTVDTNKKDYDGLVILFSDRNKLIPMVPSLQPHMDLDESFGKTLQLICPYDQAPFSRILLAPVGSLSSDVDDARRFKGMLTKRKEQTQQYTYLSQ